MRRPGSTTGQAMWHVVPLRLDADTVGRVKALTHANPLFQDSDMYRMLLKRGLEEAEEGGISLKVSPPAKQDQDAARKVVRELAEAANDARKPRGRD